MRLGWVALLVLAAAAGSESSCDVDAPTRALLCHVGSQLHASFNPCLCSHVIFPHQGFVKEAESLKERNPRLKVLYKQGDTSAAPLPEGADGVYLSLDKPPSKDSFPSDLKELVTKLDDLSSAKRAKAKYDGANDGSSDEFEIILELPSEPKRLAKHYDVKSLAKYINYFVVPSDNLTDSSQDGLAYHPSRLMGIDDILNADSLVDLLSSMGADHDKLIISMPAFGLQFSLKDGKNNMPGAPVVDSPKKVSQNELCKLISEGGWTLEREEDMTSPYAYKSTKWVSFDDATSASIKGKYVLLRNLGGIAVTSSEDDDWSHTCAGRPLVDTLHHTLTNLARKSRAAQLLSLQDQIHNSLLSSYSGDIQLSPFRIVRVIDRAGSVHVVRKEAKTEFQCSRQGYFTHPSGCNRFYRCVKFNQYSSDFTVFEYDCPAGLAFDERYEVCVWPGSLPDASACKGSSEIAPVPRSRFACSQEGYYADPENCRWFFACLDHQRDGNTPPTAYEFRCPFGLVFDNEKLACDWPWKVAGCGSGQAAYATVTSGAIYPGDILEGRLRPAYAQVSDAHVSGGRIPNVEGGLVLGTSLLKGIANQGSGAYSTGSSTYHGNGYGSGNLGAAGYGSADGQYIDDNSGAYVHDPTGDNGGEYVHQDGPQVPYIHQDGAQVPYVHQSDSGSYIHHGDSSSYRGDGDSGAYRGVGDSGAYRGAGDSGSYRGSGSYNYQGSNVFGGQGGSSSYQGAGSYQTGGALLASGVASGSGEASGSSGAYVHDSQGDHGGAYAHDGAGDHGSSYSQVSGSGSLGSYAGSTGGSYHANTGGAYIANNAGAYIANNGRGYVASNVYSANNGGAYVADNGGAYVQTSTVTGLKTGPSGISSSAYNLGSAHANDVKTAGIDSGAYLGGLGYVSSVKTSGSYSSAADHSGAYIHDTRGDAGGEYAHQDVPYIHQEGAQVPYIHQSDSGAYRHQGDNGLYRYQGSHDYQGNNGAYVHDSRGDGEGYYGGKYQVGQGAYNVNTNLYQGSNAIYGSGAYVHDARGDYGGAYNQAGYKTYGIYQANTAVVQGYDASKLKAQSGYVQSPVRVQPITVTASPAVPLKPIQYIQPAVSPIVATSPAPTVVGYQYRRPAVQPVGFSTAIPLNPVQYVQPVQKVTPVVHQAIQPVVVSTPAPPVVSYGYKTPVVSTLSIPKATIQPIAVSSTPIVPLNPVQYVSTPAPSLHIESHRLENVQGYSYSKPAVKYETPTYISTTAPPTYIKTQKIQPVVSYNYPSPAVRPVVSFQQPISVSTPAPPTVIRTEQIHSGGHVVYSPAPTYVSSTVRPITVTSTPIVPYNPVRYNTVCSNCAVSQTARPLTVTATPVKPIQPVYTYTPQQPICTSCQKAQTARPITVTSVPAVPYNPVQYVSTPAPPVVGYSYPKPAIKFETPAVQQTYTYKQVQPISVSTPAPPVVSYTYNRPAQPVVYSTPAPTYVSSTVRPITVSSTPVVPLNPVQYVQRVQPIAVSTPAPPVVGYSYPKPAIKFETPVVQQTYTYKQVQPISVSTPAPPVVSYTYNRPAQPVVYSTPAPTYVSSTVRPITVSSTPVVPLNPVQYVQRVQPIAVSTPAPPVVSYTYQKPVLKTQPVQPVSYTPAVQYQQPIYKVSTPAPQVVQYQTVQKVQPVVQYQQPIYKVSTPAPQVVQYQTVQKVKPVVSYNYPQPSVTFEKPAYVQQTPTNPPSVVSYQPVKTQTVQPFISVSSTPAVPLNPVQYVRPVDSKPIVDYTYVQQTPIIRPTGYSYPQPVVKFETPTTTSAPPVVSYEQQYVKQFVTTQAPPVVNYQAIRTQTARPITVTNAPIVPYSPVQYVNTIPPKPIVNYSYVSQPTIPSYAPVKVTTPAPPVINYSYQPQKPVVVSTPKPIEYTYQTPVSVTTPKPIANYEYTYYQTPVKTQVVSTTPAVQYEVRQQPRPVLTYNVQPQPFAVQPVKPAITVTSTPAVPLAPVQYVPPAPSKPIFSYSYVRPTVETGDQYDVTETYKVTTPRPAITVTSTPAVPLAPVQYVKPAPARPIYNYNYVRPTSTVVETPRPIVRVTTTTEQPFVAYKPVRVQPVEQYVPAQPVITTQAPVQYTPVRISGFRKTPVAVTTTEQPLGVSYYEEYFDSKKTGYEYKRPAIQLEEAPVTVKTGGSRYAHQGETYSSSFSPIIVPDISTVSPLRKRPVQTYVNTVEEESYYSNSPAVGVPDEDLNLHLDIPRVGVQLVSTTTPEQVVEVTTVAPAVKRVRVKGGVTNGGYYVRKQKVRVRPVVTSTENYPAYFTTTVKPVYSSTIDLTSPTFYTTTVKPVYSTSSTTENELDVEEGEDDSKLIQEVSGGFGSVLNSGDSGLIKQGFASSTTVSSLKDGEAIVGVVKKEREQYTGRKRTKVVVVSRLSDFNPLLVGKLGAECSCKSDTKTLDLGRTKTRTRLFRPTTTTVAEPSRDYLPTSSTPLPDELTNNDYLDAQAPIVEIKPVRKTQRVYTTTGAPLDISTVEYESSTRPARKVASASQSGSNAVRTKLDPEVDCQRPGLFRHPHLCNKFYSCNWDEWKKRYTVSVFNCPIHLAFDSKLGACNWPSKGPACAENNLLV